jgi:Spy/CpxP family protein refolding chaperone
MRRPLPALAITAFVLLAGPALAQQHSPYAGQETRGIKSLSAQELADIEAGRGMGLAKAAELNGFPGPMHVLELAEQLALTPEQRRAVTASMDAMRAEAKAVGARLIEAERMLDRRFAHAHIDAAALAAATSEIGRLQGALRQVHLAAHLETKALLSPEQIDRYNRERGYGAGSAGSDHTPHKH